MHAHIGSQIFELDSYQREVEVLFVAIDDWRRDFGFECRIFNIGGGLGIRYISADQPSSIAEFAEIAVTAVRAGAEKHGMPMPRLFVEPGRSIAGKAAVTAYTVGTVKVIPGVRTYVAVDGGMSDNLRPMLYDSKYEAMLANKAEEPATDVVTIAGKHCESGDVLVRDVHVAPPEPGDILVTPEHRRLRLRDGQQLQRAAAPGRGHGRRRPGARHHRTRNLGRRAAPAAAARPVTLRMRRGPQWTT